MSGKGLNVTVLVTPVHDCLNPVTIESGGKRLVGSSLRWILNPYDAYAMEAALRLREAVPGTFTRVITVAPPDCEKVARAGLAVGIDEAILVWDEALEGSDSYATAIVLAAVLRKQPFDLILAGWRRSDLEQGQVGPMVAELLDLAQITAAREFLPGEDPHEIRVQKRIPGQVFKVSCPLPALVTLEKGPVLRYPKFLDRRRAQNAPIRKLDLRATGLAADQVGTSGSLTQVERITPPKPTKRSALGSAVSGMNTAARLQRILSGGMQEKKESKIWECRDRQSVEKVVEHMLQEKMITL